MHETQRVYGDKLIDEKDIESFLKLQFDILKKNVEEVDESAILEKPNIYCHFAGPYFLIRQHFRLRSNFVFFYCKFFQNN